MLRANILQSLYVNTTPIKNKWDCWKGSAQNERRNKCGAMAVQSWKRMVGGFYEMLVSSAKHFCFVWETIRTDAMRVKTDETQRLRIKFVLYCPICALNLKIKRAFFCRKWNCQKFNVHSQSLTFSCHCWAFRSTRFHERLSQRYRIHPVVIESKQSHQDDSIFWPNRKTTQYDVIFAFYRGDHAFINQLACVSAAFVRLTKDMLTPIIIFFSRPESTTQEPPHKLIHHTTDKNDVLFALYFPGTTHPTDHDLVVTQNLQTTMCLWWPCNIPGIAVIM